MKAIFITIVFLVSIVKLNAQSKVDESSEDNLDLYKTEADATENTETLGLPGDNLDLYAALDLFQKSKTIEEFEASLNDEKTGINNLDLNLDGEVDFIKVVSKNEGDDFTFVLQIDVLEKEVQDVAVILVSKNKDKKVTIQMIGDESLYGKDYAIEPKPEVAAVTANPAYSGTDAVAENAPATVVVIESAPIVQYVYSPVYVPYYPPYYYGYYPPYYHPYPVVSVNIYFGRSHHHHHNHYHGGHRGGNTVIIHNSNTYNNYNRTRNTSNTVNRNKSEGSYKGNNPSKKPSTRPSKKPTTKPSKKPSSKPSTQPKKQQAKPQTKPSTKPSKQQVKPANKPQQKPKSKPQAKPQSKPK